MAIDVGGVALTGRGGRALPRHAIDATPARAQGHAGTKKGKRTPRKDHSAMAPPSRFPRFTETGAGDPAGGMLSSAFKNKLPS